MAAQEQDSGDTITAARLFLPQDRAGHGDDGGVDEDPDRIDEVVDRETGVVECDGYSGDDDPEADDCNS